MNPIQQVLTTFLPPKRKATPSGWTSFDAPCCIHNGEGADTRKRGGIMFNGDGTISYHCFNCNYTASYVPGRNITYKMRKLLEWLGVPHSEITKVSLEALRIKEEVNVVDTNHILLPTFEHRELPTGARPIMEMHDWKALEPSGLDPDLIGAIEYIVYDRGLDIEDYNFMWTPEGSYKTRLIIPFYYQGEVVGYTARKVGGGSPKYITDSQPGYVFNLDKQDYHRKYCFVVEGPLDAIAIDGVAVLSNDVKEKQAFLINSLRTNVVVVPDTDEAGQGLVESALQNQWSVAFPEWPDPAVKDVNEAVKKYGKIYTLKKIVESIESNSVKIKIKAKNYFGD